MIPAQTLAFWTAAAAYGTATLLYFLAAAFRREGLERAAFLAAWTGLAPHGVSLALRWLEVGHGPYSSRYEVLSSNVFLLVLAFAVAGLRSRGLRGLGVLVLPAAFLGLGWAVSAFGVKEEVPIIFKSAWLYLHIGFAKCFGASVVLAACCAGGFLLKAGRPDRLPRLPSSGTLDLWAHQLLLVSFLCLGVMIVAGSLWAHQSWGRYWAWDPIETSSLVTWLVFGAILHFRVLHRWSGRRMAWLTFVALAFALATLYVVILIVPSIHNSYLVGP